MRATTLLVLLGTLGACAGDAPADDPIGVPVTSALTTTTLTMKIDTSTPTDHIAIPDKFVGLSTPRDYIAGVSPTVPMFRYDANANPYFAHLENLVKQIGVRHIRLNNSDVQDKTARDVTARHTRRGERRQHAARERRVVVDSAGQLARYVLGPGRQPSPRDAHQQELRGVRGHTAAGEHHDRGEERIVEGGERSQDHARERARASGDPLAPTCVLGGATIDPTTSTFGGTWTPIAVAAGSSSLPEQVIEPTTAVIIDIMLQ